MARHDQKMIGLWSYQRKSDYWRCIALLTAFFFFFPWLSLLSPLDSDDCWDYYRFTTWISFIVLVFYCIVKSTEVWGSLFMVASRLPSVDIPLVTIGSWRPIIFAAFLLWIITHTMAAIITTMTRTIRRIQNYFLVSHMFWFWAMQSPKFGPVQARHPLAQG